MWSDQASAVATGNYATVKCAAVQPEMRRDAMQVLIIEDNQALSNAIQRGLREHGYMSEICATAAEGGDAAALCGYDAIILDRMLPDQDGLELCRQLRKREVKTPILMLTGLGSVEERVAGLNAGADDYLPKPFEFEELIARVRALLRRGEGGESSFLRYADVEIDLLKRVVKRASTPIKVRNREFELLEFFMRRPDRVLQRTLISEHVWDMNFDLSSNVIDVCIASLRRKIDREFTPPLIHTIIGVGYMFSTNNPNA